MYHMSYKTEALLYSCKRKISMCADLSITHTMSGVQFEAWEEGTSLSTLILLKPRGKSPCFGC